ncbi:chlororespiratory reduction protein 7 [Limnoraphis robusta]|uniref:Chlororespiratory reduction protein 7 n=1 Tax=Limnoraphis robusta CCNP1315 TaxID=3110306 RepID=A0ABU5TTB7_9CYAN|nr:chlororespiratory reduction protein 7 [Limnoraphis robusta]MEA5499653.1 chlororespiratory reduction protein 7 [Limnoraphis robusta BA-68 BA1]MEA5517803.1 chlororespiratory reduction protein 7 [Limnoraphis robusta CCNP1315]MEA5546391.1 chlororespiratory reduction protein 7 [Limnoraphis robusta CCNP1324]
MPDSIMYEEDHYVVLESNQPEQLLTVAELQQKLESILSERQDELPRDLQKFSTISQQAEYLVKTCCDFDLGPGKYLQWYAVRLEK